MTVRRRLLLSLAASVLALAAAGAALILFSSSEDEFAKRAGPILEPVDRAAASLADELEATEAGTDLPHVREAAGELEREAAAAVTVVRELDSTDDRKPRVLDFLRATRALANDVDAAGAELTFSTAGAAEAAAREVQDSLAELERGGGDLPLPDEEELAAAERLSRLAERCGGVPPEAVALVGERIIRQAELDALVEMARRSYRAQGLVFPRRGSPEYQSLARQAMEFLVQRVEFAQEGETLGIRVSGADVDRRLRRIKRQYFGKDERAYERRLERQGLTEEQVREDVRAQLVQERVERRVTAGAANKQRRMSSWVRAMRKRYAADTRYRTGYEPAGAKGAPTC